jgi:hypothetical protein
MDKTAGGTYIDSQDGVMVTAGLSMTIDEYLGTSFKPDAHFVDGVVQERVAGYYPHSYALGLVAGALGKVSDDHYSCLILRLRVSATRIRVCDVVLLSDDAPHEQIPTHPPAVCVEILDERETMEEALETLADYEAMSVENVWLIDITNSRGYRYEQRHLHPAHNNVLSSADGKFVLDLTPIFESLRQ